MEANMKILTLEEHRKRIENLNSAEQNNRAYLRRHRIREYLPGQAVYNLGDYPARFSIEPTEYDYNMLKDMAANGVELIQLHEEWNDPVRRFGADKYSCFDPKGLEHFIDLAHLFGIKIIPYISSGFFHELDPDFDENFTVRKNYCLAGMHFKYRRCSAGSAEWREYLLPRTVAVLDRYNFDGIFNDMGYDSSHRVKPGGCDKKYGLDEYDPEIEDLLGLIYHEVKSRGGIYKIHRSRNNPAPCKDRVYDYIWIGEAVKDSKIGTGKNFYDYVVPCPDKKQFKYADPETLYASTIPFMQFPLMTSRGRPLMGKRVEEDIPYYHHEDGSIGIEYTFNKKIGEFMREHPNGPYTYSLWSSIPDDVEDYPRWCKYLALYRPMVEANTLAYIELRDCTDILSAIPENVYASMFVNEKKYLVVSNFESDEYELKLAEKWTDRVSGIISDTFKIKKGKIIFLEK